MIRTLREKLSEACATLLDNRVISPVEPITLVRGDGSREHDVLAQVDITQDESWIDKNLAQELGLYSAQQVLERQEHVVNGRRHLVEVIDVAFTIKNEDRTGRWLVGDRLQERQFVSLGKKDCSGFLIEV